MSRARLQQLTVAPAILNFAARSATPGNLTEELVVSNSGAGSLSFTTSVVGNSSWISSVTSSSSTTTRNAPVFVQVQVNTTGLQEGAYHDTILVSSSAGNIQIPVSLFVAASGPILGVDTTGVLFQAVEGGGSTLTQTVEDPQSGRSQFHCKLERHLGQWLQLAEPGLLQRNRYQHYSGRSNAGARSERHPAYGRPLLRDH